MNGALSIRDLLFALFIKELRDLDDDKLIEAVEEMQLLDDYGKKVFPLTNAVLVTIKDNSKRNADILFNVSDEDEGDLPDEWMDFYLTSIKSKLNK